MENINNTGPEQSTETVINPGAETQQTICGQSEIALYDTREAQHIVDILRSSVYRPEAVILFGALAGGTPHSDIAAYDLLIITDEIHLTGEPEARRYLKLKMPPKHRKIGYINPYIYTKKFIATHTHSPVFYLAKTEGTVLYCHKRYRVPTQTCCDFGAARNDALYYFSHIYGLGNQLLENAGEATITCDFRRAAFLCAQAALLYFRTLFFVFYHFETDCENIEELYTSLRTLSADLMVMFDSGQYTAMSTIPRLRNYMDAARFDYNFTVSPHTVTADIAYVEKMKKIISLVCNRRLIMYENKIY